MIKLALKLFLLALPQFSNTGMCEPWTIFNQAPECFEQPSPEMFYSYSSYLKADVKYKLFDVWATLDDGTICIYL